MPVASTRRNAAAAAGSETSTAPLLLYEYQPAVAAKRTIVTCEELVSDEYIRRDPEKNKVFGACVSAVVHVPYGAWPSQCYNYYDCDDKAMKEYDQASKEEASFKEYLKKYVYDVKDNDELLNVVGGARLAHLKVVPGLGYAIR